ncbi:MAG: hypothetical protein QG577_288 [Thermodesulfobacteriota bacterium]|nr:hypothetical protein [Thermodesulfobacteriota bacterium]
MSGKSQTRIPGLVLLISLLVILGSFLLVNKRERMPEWKSYQEKGVQLTLQRLEKAVLQASSDENKLQLATEIETLRSRKSTVIETKPFGGKLPTERCLTCHFGIEDLSPSHPNAVFGCVVCHGGNGLDLTVKGAHAGVRGGRNPARLDLAGASCGTNNSEVTGCHSLREHPILNRVENVPRSLMATNAGIISILRFQWGIDDKSRLRFGMRNVTDGKLALEAIPPEVNHDGQFDLATSHFRKFCAACHLWAPQDRTDLDRLAGCPACHAPYNEAGTYGGGDPTVDRNSPGHAATHTVTTQISDKTCRNCHNRSGRIGLNYHGHMESEQYGTPFVRGGLNDESLTDGRFLLNLVPDIHHEKGMGCIDCHTAQDTMGDGSIHGFMKDQIEIRCEDCHGGYLSPPTTMNVNPGDALVQALARSMPYKKLRDGDVILCTSKGRPLPQVRKTHQGLRLTGKLTGKDHLVKVITGDAKGHKIKGHERLECDTCHSAWSPQCYGCHQAIDLGAQGLDHVSEKHTPGRWVEGRNYFRFERNIYGINSRGRVGIMVPGCQVWNTVIDTKGEVIGPYDSKILRLKNNLSSIAMGSTHPHTSRTEVPRCIDCHFDAKALGLGDGNLFLSSGDMTLEVETLYDSKKSGLQIRFPLEALTDGKGSTLQSTSHEASRAFNPEELRRIVAITPCLACHDRYDDPVWGKPGPYHETEACRKALSRIEWSE